MDGGGTDWRAAAATADAIVAAGVGPLYPGAVLMIEGPTGFRHAAAFGHAQTFALDEDDRPQPLADPPPMRVDTIFDLASVTKVAATTVAVMRLVDGGRLALEDELGALLPGFAGTDKAGVTVRHLLTHRAGLWEWQPLWLHANATDSVLGYLAALPLRYPIDARHAYSDLGFMLLGEIVAACAAMPLDRFVRDHVHLPLGLTTTGYNPAPERHPRCAASSAGDRYQRRMAESGEPFPPGPISPAVTVTPVYRRHVLRGEANDANAALAWGGVAGHAGLFAPAADLLKLTRAVLDRDPRLASHATFERFEQACPDPGQRLGWRVFAAGDHVFLGHTGFTGTLLAWSRTLETGVALLTNRVHRDDRDGAPPPALTELHDRLFSHLADRSGTRA